MNRLFAPLVVLSLAACGSGGGGGASSPGIGTVSLVLTDSATDELSQFEVDVSDITLTKLGGGTVSVLPKATRVDFLQLETLGELVAAHNLEAGYYVRMDLTLDFSNAQVVIAGKTTPASVLDQAGNAITGAVAVRVDLPTGSRPLARASFGHLFVLDLDLDQSLGIDAGNNTVTFSPVFSLDADPSAPKPTSTGGILESVNTTDLSFLVQHRATDDSVINTFTVQADSSTVFQIDGVVAIGAPGLGALVADIGERLWVQGTFDPSTLTLNAVAVESGAGVPGNGQDWVLGHVVQRSGLAGASPTLSVLGRSFDVGTGTHTYNTLHTINTTFTDTKVLRRSAGNSLDTDAVNVGQLVWVFGDLTGTTMDATATTGIVRMLPTSIFGIAAGAVASDTLTLDVSRFDRRNISDFDFTVSSQVQADPHAFTVDVTGLATSAIAASSRLRVFGWMSAVGSSGADATAVSIVDRTQGGKALLCTWTPSSSTVIDSGSIANEIAFDVGGATLAEVGDGFGPVTVATSPQPSLKAAASVGFYRIVQDQTVVFYTGFTAFRAGVLARAAVANVARISALGTFNTTSQEFSALTATVVFD